MTATEQSLVETVIQRVRRSQNESHSDTRRDFLAVEEPLEIRIEKSRGREVRECNSSTRMPRALSVTMRTPGHDFELAAGFLFGEGLVQSRNDIVSIRHCGLPQGVSRAHNIVQIELAEGVEIDFARLERHFTTTSSCGVCGKSSIEALHQTLDDMSFEYSNRDLASNFSINADVIHALPQTLRAAQNVFEQTGGLHAAALFDQAGTLLCLREDVGRHNALDKLVGAQLLNDALPLNDKIVLVSGRVSFELVQKAVVAGVPVLAAVGAPSSLAVDLARRFNLTLIGFLRDERFNIYNGAGRIAGL